MPTRSDVWPQVGPGPTAGGGGRFPAPGPTRARTARDEPPLARLSTLFLEMSGILAEAAENQVAGRPEQRDMNGAVVALPKPLLSVSDVAKRLSVNPKTVRRWREQGLLPPAFQTGGVVRWKPEDIDAWIDARCEG